MPLARVSLVATAADLDALAAGRPLGPAPLAAHAVTPALGRPGLTTDEEELEHLAWVAAAEEAVGVAAGGRRVVVSADVEAGSVSHPTSPEVPSRVELTEPVLRRQVVSLHVDEEPGAADPADLLWYDVTELDDVRALLAGE
ncbi:MAG TPA: hypothetical protein VFL46_01930 [Phycicoccus sp.]|nr:hypothetical protein [Phycicoccus sp.]